MAKTDTIQITVTDSNGDVTVLPPVTVTVYTPPTAVVSGLPATAVAGTALNGSIAATADPALTVKSVTATLNGASLELAAGTTPGTYTFAFTA